MQLIMHIFRKDVRRLWWEAAVALGLLIWMVRLDTWRMDFVPSPMEGWLHILLPFVWSYLIALAVLEDPLVGDRQFWVSMPCEWKDLLLAKLLFAVASIHLPYLLANAAILGIRGFEPWIYLPQLLWKQLSLLAMVTLPAFALAALSKNIAHFITAAVVVSAAAMLFGVREPWLPSDFVRTLLSTAAVMLGAMAVSVTQYARNGLGRSRLIGALAMASALAIYMWLPWDVSASVRCAVTPANAGSEPFGLRLADRADQLPEAYRRMYATGGKRIGLAVELTGAVRGALDSRFTVLRVEVDSGIGTVIQSETPTAFRRYDQIEFHAVLVVAEDAPPFLMLAMSNGVFERFRGAPVTIRGKAGVNLIRPGGESQVFLDRLTNVKGIGKCSANVIEGRLYEEMLKVYCESPEQLPQTIVEIKGEGGRVWRNRLGSSSTWVATPQNTWLSPLHRRQTFFTMATQERSMQMGSTHLVPREVPARAVLTVRPEIDEGCGVFPFEIRNVDLNRYLAR